MESDDDLLALAGVSGSEDEEYELKSSGGKTGVKRRLDDSDEEDDDEDDDDDVDMDGGDDLDDEDDDNEESDPYPLENKYKDEKDKAQLMAMDEMKREQILYDRLQEREKFRERKYLALRAKQSKVEKSTIKRGQSSKSLRTSRLSELKKQREKKHKRNTGDYYSEDDEEEDDDKDLEELAGYGDEDDEDDYYLGSTSRARRSDEYDESSYKIATFEEVQKIRTTRENLNKFLYRDEFDDVIPGTLVRLSVGRQGNKHMYRLARVESVKRGGKLYQFYGKPCNTYLELSQAQSTHVVEMSFISDSSFTNDEFKIYESKLGEYQMKLPTVREVKNKLDELRSMAGRKLTDEDINKIMKRKEELAVNTMDSAGRVRKVTRLRAELQVALEQGDAQRVSNLKSELDKLTKISQQNSNGTVSKLAEINIRNQKSNQEYIRKAEQRNAELRRKQLMNNDFNDPFSRLRTNPKLFYSSTTQNSQQDNESSSQQVEDKEERERQYRTSIFRNEGIDAVIKTIKLDLDVDL